MRQENEIPLNQQENEIPLNNDQKLSPEKLQKLLKKLELSPEVYEIALQIQALKDRKGLHNNTQTFFQQNTPVNGSISMEITKLAVSGLFIYGGLRFLTAPPAILPLFLSQMAGNGTQLVPYVKTQGKNPDHLFTLAFLSLFVCAVWIFISTSLKLIARGCNNLLPKNNTAEDNIMPQVNSL